MSLDVSTLLCKPEFLVPLDTPISNYTACFVGTFYVASRGLCCLDTAFGTARSSFQNISLDFVPALESGIPQPWSPVWPFALLVFTFTLGAIWVFGTLLLRLAPLRGVWFKLRRFVLLVDYAFSKKHWNVSISPSCSKTCSSVPPSRPILQSPSSLGSLGCA